MVVGATAGLIIIVESVKLNMEYFRIIGDIFSRSSWVQGLESGVGCELMGGGGVSGINRADRELGAYPERMRDMLESEER